MTVSNTNGKLATVSSSTRSLEAIRAHELHQIPTLIPPASRVLEIGAGARWQSRELANWGHAVKAIDVAGSSYAGMRVWPVHEYDGFCIPFADSCFDVVFSSNPLEHIHHVEEFQYEIRRVLAPNGVAIHVLPTGTWRWWSNIAHHLFVTRAALVHFGVCRTNEPEPAIAVATAKARAKNTFWSLARRVLFPPRHGESGNALSEIWLFSSLCWRRLFAKKGWMMERMISMQLFCTGYAVLAAKLTIRQRPNLSHLLGSSAVAYVLRTTDRTNEGRAACEN